MINRQSGNIYRSYIFIIIQVFSYTEMFIVSCQTDISLYEVSHNKIIFLSILFFFIFFEAKRRVRTLRIALASR